jgi:hypothetical protein
MRSLEDHEGWGNGFVVPHEAARLGQLPHVLLFRVASESWPNSESGVDVLT